MKARRRAPTLMLWQLILGYVVVLIFLSPLVFGDLTNALARAHVMADLFWGGGKTFGQTFYLTRALSSYIFADFVLMLLLKIFPWRVAGSLAVLLMAFGTPAAVSFYLSGKNVKREVRDLMFALTLLLSTGWFFVSGFFGYLLGLALVFTALGCLERAVEGKHGYQFGFAICVFAISLTHLSAFLMICSLTGCSALLHLVKRDGKFQHCLPGLFALAAAVLLFLTWGSPGAYVEQAPVHATLSLKFLRAGLPLSRFDMANDIVLFGVLGVFIMAGLNVVLRNRLWEKPAIFEFLALGALSLLIYFALPREQGTSDDIDARALPYAYLFFLCAAMAVIVPRFIRRPKLFRSMALLIPLTAYANLVYLAAELFPESNRAASIEQMIESLPRGKRLFSVSTQESHGRVQPLLHIGGAYTLLRDGLSPYIFSANFGHAMHYFHYRELPYTPSIFWYVRSAEINWARVRKDYDFVLVTKPFDPTRLDLQHQSKFSENRGALIAAIKH